VERSVSDESTQAQLNEMTAELLDRYEELTLLYDLGASFASVLDIQRICEIAIEKASGATGASQAIVTRPGSTGR
jgi:hypothetical protein